MAALNFRQGLVRIQSSGPPSFTPTFLAKSSGGTFIDLVVAPDPTIITFAHFDQDYLFVENKSVSQAWGPFNTNASQSFWLYWNVDFITGILSRGYTAFQPVFGPVAPLHPAVDQHWFDTSGVQQGAGCTFITKVWNGSVWIRALRVFAAQYQNSSTIVPYPIGTQIGVSSFSVNAGYPILDDANQPVQRFSRDRSGVFVHTAMPLAAQWSRLANFSVESALLQATAGEDIPSHYAVAYSGPNKLVLARNTVPNLPAIGIASEDMFTGEVRTFMVQGFVQDSTWNWDVTNTQPAGTPLFVDITGALTPNPPQSGSVQQVATIVDVQTIYVHVEPIIAYATSGSPNLIAFQLDKTSGKAVAVASTTSNPPSGTGYVHVTNGVLDTTASTKSQVTADLNVFTSTLQGLVPASGGGLTNFLRADGTWVSPITSAAVTSFNGRVGNVTLAPSDITSALGFAPGRGTTTTVSVATTNGVSGVVTNPTTTPSIALTLGAITPTSVAASGTVFGSNLSGTNTGDQTITLTGDVTGTGTDTFVVTLPFVNNNAGTFNSVTVNKKGLVTAASNVQTVTSILAGTGIGVSGTSGAVTVNNTGVTTVIAGAGIQVSSNSGNVTITSVSGGGSVTSVSATGSTGLTVGGSPITTAGTLVFTLGTELQGLSNLNSNGYVQRTSIGTYTSSTTIPGTSISGDIPGNSTNVNNTVVPAKGGTGLTTIGGPSQVLGANVGGTALEYKTITAGTGVTITNTAGAITIASSASGGTVTSVAVTGSTGLTVGGSPITTNGTINLTLGAELQGLSALSTLGYIRRTGAGAYTIDASVPVSAGGTGLTTTGTANQILGMNAAANAIEYKTVTAGSGITIVESAGAITITSTAGGGSVTSVALSDTSTTSIYTVSGSPVTSSGTLSIALKAQTKNTVLAGPTTGSNAQPTFRALIAADIPTNGVERVVWRYTAGSVQTFGAVTPISTTSGVAVSSVNATTCTATYSFTGYDHPPVAVTFYAQTTSTPTFWNVLTAIPQQFLMADSGTPTAPNLLTSFTSANALTFAARGDTDTGASDPANTGAFLIIEFKF